MSRPRSPACSGRSRTKVHLNHKEILRTLDALAVLDLIAAKVRFARTYECVCPRVSRDGRLQLRKARHPLLVQMRKLELQAGSTRIGNAAEPHTPHEDRSVVPIDVRLGDDFDILVITGPNTGGKTVTLKTVALCCLMAQSGLPIPAGLGNVPIYQDVLVDIGDEQSSSNRSAPSAPTPADCSTCSARPAPTRCC